MPSVCSTSFTCCRKKNFWILVVLPLKSAPRFRACQNPFFFSKSLFRISLKTVHARTSPEMLRQGLSYSGGFTATSCMFCYTSNLYKNSFFPTESSTSIIFQAKSCKNYWVCNRNPELVLFQQVTKATSCSTKNRSFAVTSFKIGHFLVTQDKTAAWRPKKLGNGGLHAAVLFQVTKKCPILKLVTPPIFVNICHFGTFPFLLQIKTST